MQRSASSWSGRAPEFTLDLGMQGDMTNGNQSPVWFITGCSTGFGYELVKHVLSRGWRVVATARRPEELAALVAGHEDRALALRLDVTDTASIVAAVDEAHARFGQIDVLVNNAGYGYLAAIEEGELDGIRAQFETNVFGLIETTKRVLPAMRARRSGHIVNISSIGGLVSFAATGYYHATKYAVEGLSESLSIEGAPLGIKVTVVEPGPFRTDWAGRSIVASPNVIEDYAATAGTRRTQTYERSGTQAGDPVRGAAAIVAAVTADEPPLHLVLGAPALELAYAKLERLRADFDTWKEVSLGADFPMEKT
ncbi:MAG: oxidoreductase [Vulcanimicrobiaceae bacterium]